MSDTATKVRVLVETRVIIEPSLPYWMPRESAEERHCRLERWARELKEFFRDHRSMDVNRVTAEPVYEDQCAECGRIWETYDDEGTTCCAGCGRPVACDTKGGA